METSLRLRGATSNTASNAGLRIHAKQKFPILASNALLQGHAEVDTVRGKPTYLALLARHFFPQLSANVGAGVQLERHGLHPPRRGQESSCSDMAYILRGKKAVSFTSDCLLGINVKGRILADSHFNPKRKSGAVELVWTILDFRRGQDVRIKAGYEFYRKMPYFQVRENNWTLNGYMDGKWDVRFDMFS